MISFDAKEGERIRQRPAFKEKQPWEAFWAAYGCLFCFLRFAVPIGGRSCYIID